MDASKELGANLIQESKAYGYTLSVWGTGSILFHSYGQPLPTASFAFVSGALLGFALLSWTAYSGVFVQINREHSDQAIAGSMIHFIAALGTLGISYFIPEFFNELAGFFIGGLNATITYNLLLLPEKYLSEELWRLDLKLHDRMSKDGETSQ